MNDLLQEQTKQEFQRFSEKFGPSVIIPATVIAVNDDDTIHVRFSDDSEIDDVRLKSVVKDGNKFLLVPKVDSVVQIGKIENSDECIVIAVDEIDKLIVVIDDVKIEVTSGGLDIKKGNDSLKDILTLIIEACSVIMVMQGNNPDFLKLQEALTKTQNLFS